MYAQFLRTKCITQCNLNCIAIQSEEADTLRNQNASS